MLGLVAVCALGAVALCSEIGLARESCSAQPVNKKARALDEFSDRIQDYLKLHKRAEQRVAGLKPTDEPDQIRRRQQALADAIRLERRDARQGDVLTPAAAPVFRDIVRKDYASRAPAEAKAMLAEVPDVLRIRINDAYPTDAALASIPPKLLLRLPRLSEDLEYRFLGRSLIIRDVDANLIVDFIPDVIPVKFH